MAVRVGKFEKVSYEQFEKDYMNTFGIFELDTEAKRMIESVYDKITLPTRATKGSAGYDFVSTREFTLNPNDTIKIPTGIRAELDADWVLLMFPRSGLGFKYQMGACNTIPVVDSDYAYSDNEGHIFIKLVNRGDLPLDINVGDKFMQGIFIPYGITVDDHVETTRNGGFGSTGK